MTDTPIQSRAAELEEKTKSPKFDVVVLVYNGLFIICAFICLISTTNQICDYNIIAWLSAILVATVFDTIVRIYKYYNPTENNKIIQSMAIIYNILNIVAFIGCNYVVNHTTTCESLNPFAYWMIIVFLIISWIAFVFCIIIFAILIYDVMYPRSQNPAGYESNV